ncbi:MAG: lipid-A-disaccharide synthase [Burkholderiales bacterium]|jgi:lipid-A-disaccharide synthase|nr:lipid-A-disaccharide synthase [Burkholderiales bacterium]
MSEHSLTNTIKIGIVAGEVSGDMLGALLITALRKHLPNAEFVGIAGVKMQAQGVKSWFPMERLAIRGLVEVLRHIPELVRLRHILYQRMLDEKVTLFVGIDSPDFNLGLERKLKKAGLRTIHFVSPSVWAWRRSRITKIGRAVHRVLALFPFEIPFYQEQRISVSYVGHPAAQRAADEHSRNHARKLLGCAEDIPVFALLPGSRMSELAQHTTLIVRAAYRIQQELPDVRFFAPMVSPLIRERFETLRRDVAESVDITLLDGRAEDILRAADVGLVASGTATLEAALARCPHIIYYRASALSIWIVRRMIQVPWVGLPNILAQRFVVPELIQEAATPQTLADEALAMYRDMARRKAIATTFAELAQALRADTGERAAQAVLEELRHVSENK